jgi:hypothetical protein
MSFGHNRRKAEQLLASQQCFVCGAVDHGVPDCLRNKQGNLGGCPGLIASAIRSYAQWHVSEPVALCSSCVVLYAVPSHMQLKPKCCLARLALFRTDCQCNLQLCPVACVGACGSLSEAASPLCCAVARANQAQVLLSTPGPVQN